MNKIKYGIIGGGRRAEFYGGAAEERIMFGWDLFRKSEFGLDGFLNDMRITKETIPSFFAHHKYSLR